MTWPVSCAVMTGMVCIGFLLGMLLLWLAARRAARVLETDLDERIKGVLKRVEFRLKGGKVAQAETPSDDDAPKATGIE